MSVPITTVGRAGPGRVADNPRWGLVDPVPVSIMAAPPLRAPRCVTSVALPEVPVGARPGGAARSARAGPRERCGRGGRHVPPGRAGGGGGSATGKRRGGGDVPLLREGG